MVDESNSESPPGEPERHDTHRRSIEAPRDQDESSFTPILRRLWESSPSILAAVFVDGEGECIDYCSSLPPFETKVLGAHMLAVNASMIGTFVSSDSGNIRLFEIHGTIRDLFLRRISDEHALVVATEAGFAKQQLLRAVERAVFELRLEAGLERPAWEPGREGLPVQVRMSVGWPYAPVAFYEGEARIPILAVLGRWMEEGEESSAESWVCFRVRTAEGEELTLAHEVVADRWTRR